MKTQHLFQKIAVFSLAAGLVMTGSSSWAADENAQLKEQVQVLQNRVDQLQSELASRQTAPAAVPAYGYYDQWQDPFAQMAMMQQQMERGMHRAFGNMDFSPKTDIKQTDHAYIITMDIPGMDKNKINVKTQDGMLVISGERRSESTNDNKAGQYYAGGAFAG
jgi:HSP20 family molecular chaperone IbpA